MPKLLPKIPPEDILNLLPNSVDQSKINGDLIELDASAALPQARKRFYRIRLNGSPDLHLSYGEGLKDTYERSKAFNTALPQYTCKPVFLVEDGERHLSGQEFFDGTPIDESFEFSGTTEEEVTNILKTIAATFASLERPSSTEAMVNEFERFKDSVLSNENFFELDRQFLILYLFPRLKKALNCVNPTIRWSSGDLAARNILVDGEQNFKIIDCEFAGETHFHEEDWVRLARYSLQSFSELDFVQDRVQSISPVIETFSHIRQVNLNKIVHSAETYLQHARQDLAECLWSLGNDKKGHDLGSLFLEGVASAKKEWIAELTAENKIRLAKEAELAQEKDIRVAKEAELAQEKEIRLVIEAEMAAERESRLAKEAELAQEKEIRLVVEAELVEHKDKVRRMQDSFSWKVTGPLRFLRRLRNSLLNDRVRQQDKVKSSVVHRETPLTPSIMEPLSAFEFPSTHTVGKTISEQVASDRRTGMTLHWLIPDFGIGSGGHTTIFRMISWLEQFGHVNHLWICGGTQYGTAEKARRIILRHFFPLNAKVNLLLRPEETELNGDGLICTSYDTCYHARATPFAGERFYFVQDHESEFSATGSHHFLAAETYKFGLHCITAGKWLAEKVASVGGSVVGRFDLAVDRKLFFENSNKALSPIPRIAAYARSGTPRRLTELTIFALNMLVREGLSFEVEFFGDRALPVPAAFPHRVRGVLEPAALGDLYRTCDLGCVFSATNYSLVPLEMMACGLPVVEFDGENTRKTYPENAVAFAKPTPEAIADTIRTLLDDPDLQALHTAAGRAFVQELSWEKSARQMETALSQTLGLTSLEK